MYGWPFCSNTVAPLVDQFTGATPRLGLMAAPMSGMLAFTISWTPPLSASEVEPTKANTFGISSAMSAAFLPASWPSSSTSSLSWRPQIPPAALMALKRAWTPWGPCSKLLASTPVIPLTFQRVIVLGVTPVAEAVFPALPGHRAACWAGWKGKLAGVREASEAPADPPPDPAAVVAVAAPDAEEPDPGPAGEAAAAEPVREAPPPGTVPPVPAEGCCGLPPEATGAPAEPPVTPWPAPR